MGNDRDSAPGVWEASEFDRLYARWSQPVYRYLVHLIGPGPAADDLYQETWMKAIERQDQLRDSARFGPWILRIARNLAFNQGRLGKRRAQVWAFSSLAGDGDEEKEDLIARRGDAKPGPREEAIRSERRKILDAALASLEPAVQEMLQLRYFENLTLAEVADVLEAPLGTVCSKVHRGLKTIRECMGTQGHSGTQTL